MVCGIVAGILMGQIINTFYKVPEIPIEIQLQLREIEIKEEAVMLDYCKEVCEYCKFGWEEECQFGTYQNCLDTCLK